MLSIGISNPSDFKNSYIALAELAGLAVKTNKSLLVYFPSFFLASENNGPNLPLTTLLNSLKSNSAPLASKASDFLANSVAFNLPLVPSGIVYSTLLFVRASVSSKSKTLMPLGSLLGSRPFSKALSRVIIFLEAETVLLLSVVIIPDSSKILLLLERASVALRKGIPNAFLA